MFQRHSLFITVFAVCSHIITASPSANLYETQLNPQLLKNIDTEDLSEENQLLINTCRAHSEHGTKFPLIGTENWQAITSVEMLTAVLPAYARNITISGYLALARQIAQMTDNKDLLEKRTTLTNYLDQNSDTFNRLNTIVSHAQASEQTFLTFFRQISQEEQEEIDKVERKLYFSWFGLDTYNESSTALEIGPRLNQLNTAAWYAIPTLIASATHFYANNENEIYRLRKAIKKCRYNINAASAEELEKLKKELAQTEKKLAQAESENSLENWSKNAYNQLKEKLKSKPFNELSPDEKQIVTSKNLYELDCGLQYEFHPSFKEGVSAVMYDTLRNLPCATADTIKVFFKFITGQNPVYEICKKNAEQRQDHLSSWDRRRITQDSRAIYAFLGITLPIYAGILYWRYNSTKSLLDLIHKKQEDLIAVGNLVKSMEKVHKIISTDATLKHSMSAEYAKFGELFDANSKKTSADLKNLVNALLSSSFQGSDSYFLSLQGKILATHHLLMRIKGELVPYLETFGQVDAYLSTVKLYQEFKHHPRVHFCIPEFINAPTPIFNIQEYWHPMIDAHKVVTNNLGMNYHDSANLIITGPNAGGKTTSLMSLIINIIFAQSFGIAPSSSLRLTPFAKIHSYLDITTNLQEGLSLFAAEVDRAKKLKISILSCKPGEKTFTIIDEIFSGTDPKIASDIGCTFATQLGEAAHSMTIITTHFPALTTLEEKTGRYANYKVADATVHPDGSITYPFKLIKGISSQNIAAQMLHNQGII